jgi:hypothetical protein
MSVLVSDMVLSPFFVWNNVLEVERNPTELHAAAFAGKSRVERLAERRLLGEVAATIS